MNIQVTISGKTPAEIQANLITATAAWGGKAAPAATAAPATSKKTKAAAVVEETEEIENFGAENEDEGLGFGDEPEAEVAPAKPAKTKVTEKEVNNALLAHAKENGRPATLKILTTQFKVKSTTELKPEQYAKVIAALKA